MATEVLLVKNLNKLEAADTLSAESLEAIPNGTKISATIRRSRNYKHHRKFFAMLNIIYQSQTRYPTITHLLSVVKLLTGHYDMFPVKGKDTFFVKSINFNSMDQAEFESFYNHAVDVIISEIIPGINKNDLENQVLEILGDTK